VITPAQEAALMRHVGYNGPLEEASVRLSPEQKTKLTIMAKAFKSMRAGKMPIKTKNTIGAAKGGYLFAPDELNNPRVKDRMKDNPEFSEFSVDQQDAAANKMQQRFAQPEDRMQKPARGYAVGGIFGGGRTQINNNQPNNMSDLSKPLGSLVSGLFARQQQPTTAKQTLPGMGLDNFGPGGVDPRIPNFNDGQKRNPTPPPSPPGGLPDTGTRLPENTKPNDGKTYMPSMPTPRGPVLQEGFDLFAPIANEPVKPPVESRLEYDPNSIYISPDTGNRLAYAVDSNGKVNKNNSLNVDMADQRRKARYQEALTKYNAQKAALGENFTNQQLKDYNIKIGRENAIKNNPNIEVGYYDSPEYQKVRDFRGPVNMAVGSNPYFGSFGSSTIAGMTAKAYEAYLNRTGNTSYLQGGADFKVAKNYLKPSFGSLETQKEGPLQSAEGDNNMATPQYQAQAGQTADPVATPGATREVPLTPVQKLAADQATTIANVYGDPSKVITPGNVVSTPSGPDTTIAAGTGSVSSTDPSVAIPGATGVATATAPAVEGPKGLMSTSNVAPSIAAAASTMTSATGTVGADSQVTAATDETSAVSTLKAKQGTATLMTNPVQRKIEAGELITGVADASTAAAFTEQVQAATALPSVKATVQGQLATLMDDFADGKSPVWAAGAMRAANAAMAARGLGASSIAGQAIIQATMEAALPIAQADAQVTAQFEAQNLSNRQQRAMLAAEQRANFMGMEFTQEFQARVQNSARIGDIANMNFTADQQVALENSKIANTMNLANLSNSQAVVMAEAAALSNLEMSNLNNRQQAAVQNAQNFMQMDMQNLGNAQQTTMFKQQQIMQSLFTDQAAANATSQINAASENQTQQFFASLVSQSQQFNATQTNAMSQFDAGQVNTIKRFNKEIENQRDQFNATNRLVIAQANTKWRQNIATIDTAAQNEANMQYAKSINDLTSTAIDQLWQRERDLMGFAFKASESASDRALQVALQEMSADAKERLQDDIGKGAFLGTILDGVIGTIF
jgi:hypothetical protein